MNRIIPTIRKLWRLANCTHANKRYYQINPGLNIYVCEQCGRVVDAPLPNRDPPATPPDRATVMTPMGPITGPITPPAPRNIRADIEVRVLRGWSKRYGPNGPVDTALFNAIVDEMMILVGDKP